MVTREYHKKITIGLEKNQYKFAFAFKTRNFLNEIDNKIGSIRNNNPLWGFIIIIDY